MDFDLIDAETASETTIGDQSISTTMNPPNDTIVHLNVGGTKFTTSRQTLTWIADSFFTSLLSGRIPTLRDETGAIFIDRDPQLFQQILNYLRTKQVDFRDVNIVALKHEAQYYGLVPLVKRLVLCTELDQCACGDVLFHGYLPPPAFPIGSCQSAPATIHAVNPSIPMAVGSVAYRPSASSNASSISSSSASSSGSSTSTVRNVSVAVSTHSRNLSEPPILPSFNNLAIGNRYSGSASSASGGGSGSGKPCLPSMEAKFQVPNYAAVAGGTAGSGTSSSSTLHSHGSTSYYSSIAGGGGNSPAQSSNQSSSVGNSIPSTATATGVRPTPTTYAQARGHNRASSADMKHWKPTHRPRGSTDLTRILKNELSNALKYQQDLFTDPYRVQMIRGHHNWIAVAYSHYVACYRMKDSVGWQLAYVSNRTNASVRHIALNAKSNGGVPAAAAAGGAAVAGGPVGPGVAAGGVQPQGAGGNNVNGQPLVEKLLALALSNQTINLYSINEEGMSNQLGVFTLSQPVDTLFFIGGQLVALSKTGKVGIWHGMTGNWQAQDVVPISSYDTAGSFLLLGCTNGSIYYIDMQKFPLRMKDNDLLVSELYRDPSGDAITSISVYLTPKSSLCGNWIEIAYGTSAGTVRVIVQHPETVGHSPQLFQTFAVHRAPITNVALTTSHLISVCSEYNHVRTWTVTRFRGMISTQPGSTPLASFKVLTLEAAENYGSWASSGSFVDDVGPFGDQDGDQVFVQKIVPETDQLFVRLASNGERICIVKSVDGSSISSYLVHECEGSSRMGARPRRYLFTGHSNGSIQMWDLSTGLEMHFANRERPGSIILQGPTPNELLQLIDECEITCNSLSSTPGGTPAGSMVHLPSSSLN